MPVMAKDIGTWGRKLKSLQDRLKLKSPAMAERMGVSLNTYKAWRYGVRTPSGPAQQLIDLLISTTKKK